MDTYVYCSTIYNSKDLEPTQMPVNDSLVKENVAHIHHRILCTHKKRNEVMSFVVTWMELEAIILSKLTQERKMKHHMFSLISGSWMRRTYGVWFSVPVLVCLKGWFLALSTSLQRTWTHSFVWLHSIPWCMCATFSKSSLPLMDIWVDSKSLLLWIVPQ